MFVAFKKMWRHGTDGQTGGVEHLMRPLWKKSFTI